MPNSTSKPMPTISRTRLQGRSEEHTSELQSRPHLVCRLLLEKKKNTHAHPRATQKAAITMDNRNQRTAASSALFLHRKERHNRGTTAPDTEPHVTGEQ